MKQILHSIILCMSFGMLLSCSSSALHEAEQTVSQADSLWSAGQSCDDSLALAQAYKTLGYWQWFYPDNYVHACYHYGRLLRRKDDPAAAMQTLVNATHTRSHDYHLLGRVYSNMGSICHLANEFALSYDMYDHSAGYFLKNGDTLNYFYALNDMAFELAEQGKKEEAYVLLDSIVRNCTNQDVLMKVPESKAEACLNLKQYDSVIYYSYLLYSLGNYEPTLFLLRGKAYSMMGCRDSSVYYAQYVLSVSDELFDKNSALYILTHNDDSKDREDVRKISADRSDVQKQIEIRQGKMSQAVQLLQQDLARKPDWRWAYAVLFTLVVVGISLTIYIRKKSVRHQLLSQQIEALESKTSASIEQRKAQIEANCLLFTQSLDLKKDICWNDYEKMCEIVNQYFGLLARKLQLTHLLSEKEIRLCVLVLIGISNSKQLADLLYYGESGIRNFKNRTAKKIGTNSIELREKLINIALREVLELRQ